MTRTTIAFLLLAHILGGLSNAYADKILLKNGRTIEGRIVQETETHVHIEAGPVVMPLRKDSIKSIEAAKPYENALLAAEGALQRRNVLRGIDLLLEAKDKGAPPERLDAIFRDFQYPISLARRRFTD